MAVIVRLPHPVTHEGATAREVPAGTVPTPQADETAWIDGRPWRGEPLGENSVAVIRAGVAGDDDSDPLRTVLQIALIAAVSWITLGSWGQAAVWWKVAAATTATLVGGNLIINAIAPPSLPAQDAAEQPEPIYSLTGGANRARPYAPLLLVLGTHRVFPDLASRPYTEFVSSPRAGSSTVVRDATGRGGRHLDPSEVPALSTPAARHVGGSNDQFLAQIFHWGLGALSVADLKIGDTNLVDLDDVSTQWGDAATGAITLVAGDVDTAPGGDLAYPGWVQRATPAGTTGVDLDIVGALFSIDGASTVDRSVVVEIEMWPDGEQDGKTTSFSATLKHGDPSPIRVTLREHGLAPHVWQIRMRLSAAKSDDAADREELAWAALRSYRPDTANYGGQSRLAVRARATGQLSGRIDRLSGLASQLIPVWRIAEGDTEPSWSAPTSSSNPAWIYRWYALGVRAGGRLVAGAGLAADRIDDDTLKAWGAWCDAEELTCNAVLDRDMSHQDVLALIARTGRAAVSWHGGKLGVVWDAANQTPSALFTPGNIVSASVEVDWASAQLADEVAVEYVDPDLDWQRNTVRRSVPGVIAASRTALLRLPGVTSGEQAAKECNLQAARQLYHRRRVAWRVAAEGLAVKRGDVVLMSHGLLSGGVAGRCLGVTAHGLRLDRRVRVPGGSPGPNAWPGADEPTVALRMPQGDVHVSAVRYRRDPSDAVDDPDGDTSEIHLVDFPAAWTNYRAANKGKLDVEPLDVLWRYYAADDPPARLKIVSMRPTADGLVDLQAIDETAAYYAAATSDLTVALPSATSAPPRVRALHLSAAPAAGGGVAVTAVLVVDGDWRGGEVTAAYGDGVARTVGRLNATETECSWSGPDGGDVVVTAIPGSAAAPAGAQATKRWRVPLRTELMPLAAAAPLGVIPGASGGFASAPAPPGAPEIEIMDRALRAKWPMWAGATHDVRIRRADGAWGEDAAATGVAGNSALLGDLVNGTAYVVSLRRRGPAGVSAWGEDSAEVAPASLTVPALRLDVIEATEVAETVLAEWTPIGAATSYDVQTRATAAEDVSTNRHTIHEVSGNMLRLGATWIAGVSYSVRVRAVLAGLVVERGDWSAWSQIVVASKPVTLAPGRPRDADQPPGATIDTWTAGVDIVTVFVLAPSDGSSVDPANDLQGRIRPRGHSAWGEWRSFRIPLSSGVSALALAYRENSIDRTTFSLVLRGLAPNTAYDVQVRAVNDVGAGPIVDVPAVRTESTWNYAVNLSIDQSERLPAPSTPRPIGADFAALPVVAWPAVPSWIDAWAAATAYKAGDRAAIGTAVVVCITAHASVAGGLSFGNGVLGGTQAANWQRLTWRGGNRDPRTISKSWWYDAVRSVTVAPIWAVEVTAGGYRAIQTWASGAEAPSGTTEWYLRTGATPSLHRRYDGLWREVLGAVSTSAAPPQGTASDYHLQTPHNILWRRKAKAWLRLIDPHHLFSSAAGVAVVGGVKYATVRTSSGIDDYTAVEDVQHVLHLPAVETAAWDAGRPAGILYAKAGASWQRYDVDATRDVGAVQAISWANPSSAPVLVSAPSSILYIKRATAIVSPHIGFWDIRLDVDPLNILGGSYALTYRWTVTLDDGSKLTAVGSHPILIALRQPQKITLTVTNGAGIATTARVY